MASIKHDQALLMVNEYYKEKQTSRREALKARDFRDGKQLSDAERKELKRKGLPDTVIDMIGPKVDHLQGIEINMEIGPECLPVTPDDVNGCSVSRHCIEYVLNSNKYKAKRSTAFDNEVVEGEAGFYVYLKNTAPMGAAKPMYDVCFDVIRHKEMIYDFFSGDDHFQDAKYKGFMKYLDAEDLKNKFKGKDKVIDGAINAALDHSHPQEWISTDRNRVAVVFLNVMHEGHWQEMLFTLAGWLVEPQKSILYNDLNETIPSVMMTSAYIDSDNDRYGIVRRMMDPQKIVNKSHQMATHAIRASQIRVRQDVYNDKKRLATIRNEASRADGVIPWVESPDEVALLDNSQKVQGNLELAARAQLALDQYGANSALTGDFEDNASGKALDQRANQGSVELSRLFTNHKELLTELYKTIWFAARMYWPENKVIRISGIKKAPEFVELNKKKPSLAELAQAKWGMIPQSIIDEAREKDVDLTAPQVENELAKINVDIVITETENHANMAATQFEALRELHANSPDVVTAVDVIKASNLANKDEIIERHEKAQAQNAEANQVAQQQAQQLQQSQVQAMNNALNSQAQKDQLEIQQQQQEILIEASEAKVDNEKTVAETAKIYHEMNQPQQDSKPRMRVQAGF